MFRSRRVSYPLLPVSSPVEQIKAKLNIADVIGSYVKLDRAGANYKACCPFHREKTPSFFISPDRGTFHCFGCDRGGDLFTFVQDMEGIDFLGALKMLAERAGVTLRESRPEERKERDRLFAVMDAAALYYRTVLVRSPEVAAYLSGRGLTAETIADFRIGYAPDEWRSVSTFLAEKGFSVADMEKAGLVIVKGPGSHYDRFRGRVMFPIMDTAGRVIAFSGRVFGDTSADTAKYINSPETEIYRKSAVLYGLDKAKGAIRSLGCCVLVEGQVDVIMAHQAGTKHAVASSGTALTPEHVAMIGRLTDTIIMSFDGDAAGISASGRAVNLAAGHGLDIRLVALPQGADPADIVRADPEQWRASVASAVPVVDFYLAILRRLHDDDREYRKAVERTALPYIAHIKSKIDQAQSVARIARALGVTEEPVWEEFRKVLAAGTAANTSPQQPHPASAGIPTPVVSHASTRMARLEDLIIGHILAEGESSSRVSGLAEEFMRVTGTAVSSRIALKEEHERERVRFEAEAHFGTGESASVPVFEALLNLEEQILRSRLAALGDEVRRAEADSDTEKVRVLVESFAGVTGAISTLTARKKALSQ